MTQSGAFFALKDPDAVLDYRLEWSTWLATYSDTISSGTVTASSTGITIDSQNVSGTQQIAWVSGGTAGNSYTLNFQIVTAGGRTEQRTITLEVQDR